jgi:hypothetical protein
MMSDTYEDRVKRYETTLSLNEPDRVPCMPFVQNYPQIHAGYTVAECIYDVDKGIDAFIRYTREYQPDEAPLIDAYVGMGKIMELQGGKRFSWAGAPGSKLDKNSMIQFIESPLLLDDEFEFFDQDLSGWFMQKAYSRMSGLLEPFASASVASVYGSDEMLWGSFFSRPDVKKMIQTYAEIEELSAPIYTKLATANEKIEEMGFPIFQSGLYESVPYDFYSSFLRGTNLTMEDLFERRDSIERFCKWYLGIAFRNIEAQARIPGMNGKKVTLYLLKGFDGFLNNEQYENLYWKDLQAIILKIIEVGMVPYIYTEGSYNTRLKYLKDVPPGKVYYHFENVDMAHAKKELGNVACISGGFPAALLTWGTKQQVIDECKRLIDICAPGGGYIFDASAPFDDAKEENVEAMFETVKTYGVY